MSQKHNKIIIAFYEAFSKGKAAEMVSHYHNDIVFEDPAFGQLKGEEAKAMWRMLIERSKGNIKITYSNVEAENEKGSAFWQAEYIFGPDKRKVINKINASFKFKDGKIIQHTDRFDVWKWAKQALGWKGWLLGWTPLMKKQIQKQSRGLLKKYMARI
ncbi:Ketosteroid isomerase-related protein [Aquiflexum balticum DSM 16537]|uniref:Ketosteroid isomerase-related protein n=1 Tax=Aquiflexum balticum DSM 16537 TaxID=758820 RepID=A0A1W2H2J7_9BACT|nr:nuclear transport factor 2 family protein [Aquiflexum balticum]SMD42994.1 Ketosteroid isomerase-related protein [Aquiflexum balticum DSM 16537]